MKRTFIMISLICISMFCFPTKASAAEIIFSDVKGHWAEGAIMRWAGAGVLQGANGKFRPNDTVTRAELAVILNRLLKYPDTSTKRFTDTKESEWYYQAAANLKEQDMLAIDSEFSGNYELSRMEAVFMIAKTFGIPTTSSSVFKSFDDMESSVGLARGHIRSMHYRGYINGKSGNLFQPRDKITRAEVVTILNNMIDLHIDKPGTYDNLAGKRVLVTSPEVTIKNSSPIHLFISPGVGTGKVSIDEKTAAAADKLSYFSIVGISPKVFAPDGKSPEFAFTQLNGTLANSEAAAFSFEGGNGTKESPYQIAYEHQLKLLSELQDKSFVLNNDIVLKDKWTSIWSFKGQLDGRGFAVKNLKNGGGLFTYLYGDVKNLTIQCEVNEQDPDSRVGFSGSIATYLKGSISNCHADVNVTLYNIASDFYLGGLAGRVEGRIENSTASGKIILTSDERVLAFQKSNFNGFGGIAGYALESAVITGCESTVVIDIKAAAKTMGDTIAILAGGICGRQKGTIENSSALKPGSVSIKITTMEEGTYSQNSAGGIVGEMNEDAKMSGCFSNIAVSNSGGDRANAGGLIGNVMGDAKRKIEITRSYAAGVVKASDSVWQNDAGGLIGHIEGGLVTECWSGGTVMASGDPVWLNAAGGLIGGAYEGNTKLGDNTIQNCYSIASVSVSGGTPMIGSFVGRSFGTFENCYGAGTQKVGFSGDSVGTFRNCGDFSNSSDVSKNWDFNAVWMMPSSGSYKLPILRNLDQNAQTAKT